MLLLTSSINDGHMKLLKREIHEIKSCSLACVWNSGYVFCLDERFGKSYCKAGSNFFVNSFGSRVSEVNKTII